GNARQLPALPEELYLEVTNRCNLKCTTCPQSWGMPEESADLTPETARALLDQLSTVRRVVLHGIGEPTLNPRLEEIIAVVKERGAYALFNTNGLLLRGALLETLVRSGLDEVRISVDAATPETYELVRGADMFTRVIANATALNETRERLGETTPRVSLWMTGMKSNIRELPTLVRIAAGAGIAEVYVQRLVFSGRNLADQQEALYGQMGPAEREGLANAERLALELGVTLRGSSEALPPANAPTIAERPWSACRRPTSLMYVTANGNVLPCCISPFTEAPYESLILGSTVTTGLEEIWNGSRYEEWRSKMQSDEPPQACSGCGSAWAL
ncbi:MAG: radical SAM/SPASM domain-containing protein, partial [Dehalococcoidia bacterium]